MLPVNPMSISAILNPTTERDDDFRHAPKLSQSPQEFPGFRKGRTAKFSRCVLNPQKNCFLSAERNQKVKGRKRRKEDAVRAQVGHAPSAQILFFATREGAADLQPIPVGGAPAWKRLPVVSSAPLPQWTVNCGDVIVGIGRKGKGYAKVTDLRRLLDGRYVIVYAWLYTRSQIAREMEVDAKLPAHALVHIDTMWPPDAAHKLMLSTNRTITMWDTAIAKAPQRITTSICEYAIYNTTALSRQIVNVDHPKFQWMRNILTMKPGIK